MSDQTRINPALEQERGKTVLNPALSVFAGVEPGTELPGGYSILRRLDALAGEADIYICEKDGAEFAAKLYRRPVAVKGEVIEALREVDCPYIAPLYDTGFFGGRPFEILPYYRRGSLRGRKFSFEELKNRLIPEINEGLAALHDVGIIHKDLKPSNIMLTDSGDIAIIDFGISSVQTDGNTVVVTSTGMTPEYSAPETFRRLFLEESDYYSFGVTLYELYCGHTPYADMSAEEIAQYTAIQRIPLPEDMPPQLKALITALTYCDLTNRRRRSSPDRRWTYAEVDNWCRDIPQPIPGEGAAQRGFPAYTFLNVRYSDLHSLVAALAENWEQGKKQVFRGLLSAFLKPYDPQLAGYALDAEDEAAQGADTDLAFFWLIYRLDPENRAFYWRGRKIRSMTELGEHIIDSAISGEDGEFVTEVLEKRLISAYVRCAAGGDEKLLAAAQSVEDNAAHSGEDMRGALLARFMAGFALSSEKRLRLDGMAFSTPDELVRYMKALLDSDALAFGRVCDAIIGSDGMLDPQFEAWLIALGKRKETDRWYEQLFGSAGEAANGGAV